MIDINIACEPDEQMTAEEPIMEEKNQKLGTRRKDHIDLNYCASDSEDPSPPCYEWNGPSVKIMLEIDLEVPILPESEDDSMELQGKMLNEVSSQPFDNQNKEIQNEVLRDAAETLVGISSCPQVNTEDIVALPSEASFGEMLLVLADAISSDSNKVVNASVKDESPKVDSSQEMDDFEAMVLHKTTCLRPNPRKWKRQELDLKPEIVGVIQGEKAVEGLPKKRSSRFGFAVKARGDRGSPNIWRDDESHGPYLEFRVGKKKRGCSKEETSSG